LTSIAVWGEGGELLNNKNEREKGGKEVKGAVPKRDLYGLIKGSI